MKQKADKKEWKFYKILGQELRKIRESKGMKQKDVAEKINKSPQAVQFIEQGKIRFNLYSFFQLAEALQISSPLLCAVARKAYEEVKNGEREIK
jgi:transcriptional regulator with XRE-family HTH domain